MERATAPTRVVRFGPFELARDAGELRKNGIRLKLQDQPFQILCTLLDHPSELVSREQLCQQLWPDGTFVDFEHGLNTAIRKLRDVLSDDADTPRYIETVPRKGYRFIAAVNGHLDAEPKKEAAPYRARRLPIVVAATITIAVLTLSAYLMVRTPRLTIVSTKQLTFTGDVAFLDGFPIQSDGRRVYYTRQASFRIFSVPVHGGQESSFATAIREPVLFHISPNGSTLLAGENVGPSGNIISRIWLVPTNGGPARPLANVEACSAAWSPDGKKIIFDKGTALYETEDEGASSRKLFDLPGRTCFTRWAPDGGRFRFDVTDLRSSLTSIWEGQAGRLARPFAPRFQEPGDICCGGWTRDGRYYFFRRVQNERTEYWYTGEGIFHLRGETPALLTPGGFNVSNASASPLENQIFIVAQQFATSVVRFDPATGQAKPFLPEFNGKHPGFSRDGSWVAIAQHRNNESILWRARADGSEWLQLTDPRLNVFMAQYSPNGKQIAMMAKWPDKPWKIYIVSHEGGTLTGLDVPIESQSDPNWTADGESIIFGQVPKYMGEPDVIRALYIYNLRTKSLVKLPNTEGWFSPRLSPDGRHLIALSIEEHKVGLYDLATHNWRTLVDEANHRWGGPFWSADGAAVYAETDGVKEGFLLVRIRLRDGVREPVIPRSSLATYPSVWLCGPGPNGTIMITINHPNSNIFALEYR